MIDTKFNKYPDFDKLVATCRTNPSNEMYQLCINSFDYLFKKCNTFGHIPDEIFEEVGFSVDKDNNGKKVKCLQTLTHKEKNRKLVTIMFSWFQHITGTSISSSKTTNKQITISIEYALQILLDC